MKKMISTMIMFMFFFSCENNAEQNEGHVQFGFQNKTDSRSRIIDKTPSAIILTIVQGSTVIHQDLNMALTNFNGNIVTEPLPLLDGDYSITDFKVVNAEDSVVYATPIEGSTAARLVDDPLDIDFSVTVDGINKIKPEVLDTEEFTPEDFGYPSSGFTIVPTMHFLISVKYYDESSESYVLTDANVEVLSGTHTDFSESISSATTTIQVRDYADSTYTVTVTKSGFQEWSQTYTNAELKSYDGEDTGETPINVILQAEEYVGSVSVLAGSTSGYTDANGTSAKFKRPVDVVIDSQGNIFVADHANHVIRKINSSGDVTTFAGDGSEGDSDGNGTSARFNQPFGLAIDLNDTLYVAEQAGSKIRKVAPNGDVTTFAGSGVKGFADGVGTAAKFYHPTGLEIDQDGVVYVADGANNRVRKITTDGTVSTLAGGSYGFVDGNGTNAQFKSLHSLDVGPGGNIYVADMHNHAIRKITPSGDVTTIAGTGVYGFADGDGSVAQFAEPKTVYVNPEGMIFIGDSHNKRIRMINLSNTVSTVAGDGSSAIFGSPFGLFGDSDGNIIVADYGNHTIQKVTF